MLFRTIFPLLAAAALPQVSGAASLDDVNHIIVIYLENRSFDNLYGFFPGADGLANAGATATQVDGDGKPYDTAASAD
jgi:phospholipase C